MSKHDGNVLITGGAGFIGLRTAKCFIESGFDPSQITLFDMKPVPEVLPGVRCVLGDITCPENLRMVMSTVKPGIIIHLASIKDVQISVNAPCLVSKVNVLGTINLLVVAKELRDSAGIVPRIIFASSAGVYGSSATSPVRETHPLMPENPYHASKVAAESFCIAYHNFSGLPVIILRYSNVYGGASGMPNVVDTFVKKALVGEKLVIYGGQQRKQFTYISDVCRANLLAARSDVDFGIFNIAGDASVSILTLAKMVCEETRSAVFELQHSRAGDPLVPDLTLDTTAAEYALRFIPFVDLRTGLRQYIEEVRNVSV